jgi:CheY-like chemotaxis protein
MAKILLVEDDNNLREIYEARLQAEGYTIVSARDGEEALVIAKAEKPDLVISDIMMPKISGFEMLDILRNTEGLKEVKVIMLTALGQSDDQQRADKLGADRYLVKSQVTLEDIVKAAHDLLDDGAAPATVAKAAVDPPKPPAEPTAPAPTPAPVPTPAPAPPVPPTPTVTNDDKVMNDAVGALVADTKDEKDETDADSADDSSQVPVAHKKVIKPIDKPVKDIQTLLAEEEAKEAGTTTPAPTLSAPAAETTAAEEAAVDAKIEDFVAGASSDPTPPPTAATPPPATEIKPSSPAVQPKDSPPASASSSPDPNIIAL